MKIYNKALFASGVFMLALSAINLVMNIMQNDVDTNTLILVIVLFVLGLSSVTRSVSRQKTREDRLEQRDERNQLVELKSKSKSFQITQTIAFVFMLILFVAGKLSGDTNFVAMGVGLGFVFTISMFAELFTYLYYEAKN